MFEATADEIESFEVITRTSPFGAEVFDRLWTRITDAASSVFNFVMTEDHHAPGLLSFDADEELGEAVVADIRNENLNDWLIVFARFDYGPLVCVVPWQRPQDGAPFFFPPHYATDVQVVSAVISARQKPLTKTPPLALQELNDLPEGRVRWAASRFDLTS